MKNLLREIKIHIEFAFWVWPSIIGMFVCLCYFYSIYYLVGYLYPPALHLTTSIVSHRSALIYAAILGVAGLFGTWKPIIGGLSVMYVVAIITSAVAVASGNYISIGVWILFIGFATYSVVRTTAPYYRSDTAKDLEKIFKTKKRLKI